MNAPPVEKHGLEEISELGIGTAQEKDHARQFPHWAAGTSRNISITLCEYARLVTPVGKAPKGPEQTTND